MRLRFEHSGKVYARRFLGVRRSLPKSSQPFMLSQWAASWDVR
jgi:hypothetical protein